MKVGTINEIMRHPVKSMTGETVTQTMVMNYGLYGDRSHALLDEKESFFTITQFPNLVQYQASFSGPESLDAYPEPLIMTPEGQEYKWSDVKWLSEIETSSLKKLSKISYLPESVPIGAIEEEHLLLVTDSSLEALSHSLGNDVEKRRFRPNLEISLYDKNPFVEKEWEGKTLQIGQEVKIEVIKPCERCMIITVDPKTGTKQPALLKKLVKEHHNLFGMYARVVETGRIHNGDAVTILGN